MGALVKYDAMCHAIDVAYEFDEVKDIRDQAAMLEAAARVAGNTQAEDRCYEIRRRAERKAAKLYDAQEKAKPSGSNQHKKVDVSDTRTHPTLEDLGTSRQEMGEWRKLANVPQKQFDAAFAEGGKPSVAQIVGKPKVERSPASAAALWVWGRIQDFERNGTLKVKPKACFKEMAEHQAEDIVRLLPSVIEWLDEIYQLATKE